MDLQKTIAETDLEVEESELEKSFSESEAETSFSRLGSFSSSTRKRRESTASKFSVTEVISVFHLTLDVYYDTLAASSVQIDNIIRNKGWKMVSLFLL